MSSVYPPFGGPPAQRCLRCGTPLPVNVVTCVNCGTYNPVAHPGALYDQRQVQWGSSQPQPSVNGSQYSGTHLEQPSMYPSQLNQRGQPSTYAQNNPYGVSFAPQTSPPSNNFYPMPGQNKVSNFNTFYSTPQQSAYYSTSMNAYGNYIQSPARKRGSRMRFIVGLLLLVLVLFIVGGAGAGYYYYSHHYQSNTSLKTNSSAIVTPTAVPLFSDSFVSNNMGWDLTSNPGKFTVKVGGGSLVLEDDENKFLLELVPGKIFTDFRLDVNATLTKGDPNNGYGVLIRASSQGTNLSTYYRFELYGDGTYAIFKGFLDSTGTTQSTNVQGYLANPAIAKAGQVNHLTIIAKGPVMSLMVNGQKVYTYTDDNYKGGSIALFVSNLPKLNPGAQATFTHLAVFPAPA